MKTMQTVSITGLIDENSKPPRSSKKKKLSWPFKPWNADVPVCEKPSAFDLRPPWRPFTPQSAAFEPRFRLLCADEWAAPKTMRVCRQELFLERTIRPSSAGGGAASQKTLHCDCFSHWNNNNNNISRPSTAPAGVSTGPSSKLGVRPKKRPAWRPGSTKSGAFDCSPGLLCDPGPVGRPHSSSAKEKMHCKTCGLRAKNAPLLRNFALKIENLMREAPWGWCVVNR